MGGWRSGPQAAPLHFLNILLPERLSPAPREGPPAPQLPTSPGVQTPRTGLPESEAALARLTLSAGPAAGLVHLAVRPSTPGAWPGHPRAEARRPQVPASQRPSTPVLALFPRAGLPVSCSYGRLRTLSSVMLWAHAQLASAPHAHHCPSPPCPLPSALSAARVQERRSHACALFSLWAPWGAVQEAPLCSGECQLCTRAGMNGQRGLPAAQILGIRRTSCPE